MKLISEITSLGFEWRYLYPKFEINAYEPPHDKNNKVTVLPA